MKVDEARVDERLDECLQLLSNAHAHYARAPDSQRRILNQAVFANIYVDDD